MISAGSSYVQVFSFPLLLQNWQDPNKSQSSLPEANMSCLPKKVATNIWWGSVFVPALPIVSKFIRYDS